MSEDTIIDQVDFNISIPIERRKCYAQNNNMQFCQLATKCQHYWNPIDPGMPGYLQMMMPPEPFDPETGCKEFWDVKIKDKQSIQVAKQLTDKQDDKLVHKGQSIFSALAGKQRKEDK